MAGTILVLVVALIWTCAFAWFGAWIAGEKGRERSQGAIIGFLFGPLGVLILALLPGVEKPKPGRTSRGRSRSIESAWNRVMPDDWTPEREKEEAKREENAEDQALRYLSEN